MNSLILNVDDNEPSLYAKSRILRQAAFDVLEAESGERALRHVRTAKPQLVLLDMKLPDMSGYDVCRIIKSDPKTASTIVLQISSTFAERADRVRGLEGGADGYLTEPVDPSELLATIRALLRLQKVEQALRESESKYRTLVESMADGVYAARENGFVFANESLARMLGYTVQEFAGLPFEAVIAPEFRFVWMEHLRDCVAGASDSLTMHELRLLKKDRAEPLWAEVRGRPVIYDGEFAVLGTFRDVTEHKHMEQILRERTEALVQQDRNKDEFLAMLAHELRNPLAPLMNALAILDANPSADTDALYAMMRRQVAQLTRLVSDLVDVSRVTSGKIKVTRAPLDLRDVLHHAVETSRPLLDARGHHFDIKVPSEPFIVSGDATRLAQVFLNLLNNAAKYTDDGGRIEVVAEREGEAAVVRVRDNGRGIPAALLPHIFDLFVQADRTLTRSQDGLGIGLTLARRLVHEHGGELQARSEGPGRGSEFIARLPLAHTQDATRERAAPTRETEARRQLRIVVVDDSADTVMSYEALLQDLGHEVRTLTDARKLVETAEAFSPHVIALDISMPGINGLEAAALLRERFGDSTPRLIAITGYSDAHSKQLIREAGFAASLVKPSDRSALQEILASLS
jgi:PAS domain S-box-containing protein